MRIDFFEKGWECPKCGAVMSPTTSVCVNCRGYGSGTTVGDVVCNRACMSGMHLWECVGVSTAGSTYRCQVCGKTKTESYDQNRNEVTISLYNKGGEEK